jgi:hypothetical protein
MSDTQADAYLDIAAVRASISLGQSMLNWRARKDSNFQPPDS